LSVDQGALTATIETDNSNARQVLLDNLPALRDRLADQNVRIERFDVDVRRDGEGSGQSNSGPHERAPGRNHEPTPQRQVQARGETNGPVAEEAAPVRRAITPTSINVIA
jgi:flagellar hook-length control protein FliK